MPPSPYTPINLPPASGIGRYWALSAKIIRFARHGCTNRPFYHIVVMEVNITPKNFFVQFFSSKNFQRKKNQHQPVIEQVGTYDAMTNEHGEKLVSLNFERIRYWIGSGAHVSLPVAELLGISGFYPIHPRTYMTAWRNRQINEKKVEMESKEPESSV